MDTDVTTIVLYISVFVLAISSLAQGIEVCSLWPSLRIKLTALKLWLVWKRIDQMENKMENKIP